MRQLNITALGEIIQNTCVVPIDGQFYETQFFPFQIFNWKMASGLAPNRHGTQTSSKLSLQCPVPSEIMYGTWEMLCICWEVLTNDTVTLINFSCEVSKHSFNPTELWCTAQPAVSLQFTLVNKMYVNHDVEELSSLTLSLNAPHEVIVEETHWLMKDVLNS